MSSISDSAASTTNQYAPKEGDGPDFADLKFHQVLAMTADASGIFTAAELERHDFFRADRGKKTQDNLGA